ncbi:DMT family transporter [Sinorhizobium mexicanum]|uniref:DMT family transporter n=1 Tax=Sinorhizobium mexicanum TaxID=375549 RepID=A0A859QDI0_9HYPH|nr:DMT family transporter [Sinorhizobium mexicanum]MBP1887075.1 drug/metabolite transporter (DMT)-like permease [Sinorhizobium mexicanum]QLL60324.1 DMT family transporter [Sinorhizobium mexicanum]
MSRQFQGYIYLSLAMALVGSTVIASKVIASGLPPFTATALRFALAFPLFLVLMRATRTAWPKLQRRDWLILFIQAGAGSVGYTTLLISGLRLTSAADAGVIIGTLPIVSAAIAIVVLGERPDRSILLAITLAAGGVLSIVFRASAGGAHSLLGNTLVFGAVICEGLFILINKRLTTATSPLALSTLMAGLGVAVSAPIALLEFPQAAAVTTQSIIAVAYYALVPTVGGFLLWYAGLARVSGTEASVFTAIAPVSAVLLAFAMLGEPISANQLIGIACVLAALLSLGLRLPSAQRRRSEAG